MEAGTQSKKTIFVGGIGDDVDQAVILENFATFGPCHVSIFSHAFSSHMARRCN